MTPAHLLDGADEFCVHCDDTFTEECADAGHEPVVTDADFHWVICDRCNGNGTLRGYPGAYTADEFAEAFADDPDEYLDFRRDCEDCNGSGKLRALRPDAETRPAVAAWLRGAYDVLAIERQERRYGA